MLKKRTLASVVAITASIAALLLIFTTMQEQPEPDGVSTDVSIETSYTEKEE